MGIEPTRPAWKAGVLPLNYTRACYGADDETRTRDPNLGKVVLYQLSYVRNKMVTRRGFEPLNACVKGM